LFVRELVSASNLGILLSRSWAYSQHDKWPDDLGKLGETISEQADTLWWDAWDLASKYVFATARWAAVFVIAWSDAFAAFCEAAACACTQASILENIRSDARCDPRDSEATARATTAAAEADDASVRIASLDLATRKRDCGARGLQVVGWRRRYRGAVAC
jgi:hypothetical protein